jgi:tRNA(Arg) A34 adenosine deaminase TadA
MTDTSRPTADDERWMDRAIEQARLAIAAGQTPFGCVIVRDGQQVAAGHNEVWTQCDPTAHAEVLTIRRACGALGTIDLTGCVLYSTTEPCPMCFTAIHWARIDRLVFGARIADARAAGFNELCISNEQLKADGGSEVQIVANVRREPCGALFDEWIERVGRRTY